MTTTTGEDCATCYANGWQAFYFTATHPIHTVGSADFDHLYTEAGR